MYTNITGVKCWAFNVIDYRKLITVICVNVSTGIYT